MSMTEQERARVIELIDEVLKGEMRRGKTTTKRVIDLVIGEMKKRGGRKAFGAANMKRSKLVVERLQAPLDFPPIENIVERAFTEYLERHGPELRGPLSENEVDALRSRAIGEYLERHGFNSLADALQQEEATVGPAEQSKRGH